MRLAANKSLSYQLNQDFSFWGCVGTDFTSLSPLELRRFFKISIKSKLSLQLFLKGFRKAFGNPTRYNMKMSNKAYCAILFRNSDKPHKFHMEELSWAQLPLHSDFWANMTADAISEPLHFWPRHKGDKIAKRRGFSTWKVGNNGSCSVAKCHQVYRAQC